MHTDSRTEQRRASLLQAALELFVEKGFHETKVSEIVERAGVAQGTFYLYFSSKREAFNTLMGLWFDALWRVLEESSRFRPATLEEAAARAHADVATVFRLCADRPLLARLMLKQAEGVGPDVSERLEDFRVRVAAHIEQTFTLRQEAGLVRPFNARVLAHSLVGMVERVAFRWFVMGETPPLSPEDLAEELVQFQVRGIARDWPPAV
ncbi:MAG: TetR/AcrR family transcriptional regulator [Chloroflexi bacterium]|nr:TetR/AcrR family transcriptional regulator [Chloroflexota bacterium]